jgi:hypothetical protein
MNETLEVYGYHGTSRSRAERILAEGFMASDNDYDWLGTGIYFFQDAPFRAKLWAEEQHPQEPAVLQAVLRLENCIDLLDIKWHLPLIKIYDLFEESYRSMNELLPTQNPERSKAHRLDCSFFNYSFNYVACQGKMVESIRAAFIEGERLFPRSAIFDLAHVQVAIRSPSLIQKCRLIEI